MYYTFIPHKKSIRNAVIRHTFIYFSVQSYTAATADVQQTKFWAKLCLMWVLPRSCWWWLGAQAMKTLWFCLLSERKEMICRIMHLYCDQMEVWEIWFRTQLPLFTKKSFKVDKVLGIQIIYHYQQPEDYRNLHFLHWYFSDSKVPTIEW